MACISRVPCFCLLGAVLAAPVAHALTSGQAEVGVTRFSGQDSSQIIPVPQFATDFTTPAANLAAVLQPTQTARAQARAVAGLDIADGALFGNIATFARAEVTGPGVRAYAGSRVAYSDIFEVRSDTLAVGTLIDVVISPVLVHMGNAGSTGFGACCWVRSVYEFRVAGNIFPYDSYYRATGTTLTGVLGGNGIGMAFNQPLGSFSAQGVVGERFYVQLALEAESEAWASGVFERDFGVHAGQSEAAASAVIVFSTGVFPAATPLAAAAFADEQPSAGYLIQATSGLRLPGSEALDAANVQAHLLALAPVPEPASGLLMTTALGMVLIALRWRKSSQTPRGTTSTTCPL